MRFLFSAKYICNSISNSPSKSSTCYRIFHVFSSSYSNSSQLKPEPSNRFPDVDEMCDYEPGLGREEDLFRFPTKKQYRMSGPILKKEFQLWKNEWKERLKFDPAFIFTPGEINKVFEFSDEDEIEKWSTTSDQELGVGYSKCTLTKSTSGHALFSGNLSTQVPKDGKTFRAGFCAIRAPRPMKSFGRKSTYDWTQYTHLVFKIRGDGRSYLINLGAEGIFDVNWYNMYCYGLHTRGGPYWQLAKIPFSKFIFGGKGYIQDRQDPVSLDDITTFGITLCDDIEGPFQLEIDYIGLELDLTHSEESAYEIYDIDKMLDRK